MPNYVKLKNAGDAIVLHCEGAKVNTSGKWPTIDFAGKDAKTHQPVVVAVPQKSAERQMERIGLTIDACKGLALGISRAPSDDPEKPYWNMAVVGEWEPLPAPLQRAAVPDYLPGHPVSGFTPEPPPLDDEDAPEFAAAPAPVRDLPVVDPLYQRITEWVLAEIVPLYDKANIPADANAVAAMVATCFIQANRNR